VTLTFDHYTTENLGYIHMVPGPILQQWFYICYPKRLTNTRITKCLPSNLNIVKIHRMGTYYEISSAQFDLEARIVKIHRMGNFRMFDILTVFVHILFHQTE
jgi:hypothetical protein